MTKKELEKQAKEYGYTVKQIKEFRKHIKPFLEFAIKELNSDYNKYRLTSGLCAYVYSYIIENSIEHSKLYKKGFYIDLKRYLKNRLHATRPKRAITSDNLTGYWWGHISIYTKLGCNKRVNFCKKQLKLIKNEKIK